VHPLHKLSFPGGTSEIRRQLSLLGKVAFEEKIVLIVFTLTAFAWISKSFLLVKIFPAIDDSIIALTGAMLLFVLPAKNKESAHILTWTAAKEIPWGIILLFGGGLAIAEGFKVTELATWIAGSVSQFQGISLILLLLITVSLINFLTEITSNVATTAMVLPVLASIAFSLDVHPFGLLFGTTIAASCAFMLPVATPPNAVVFGSNFLKMKDMVKAGFSLNIISIIIIIIYVYFVLPAIWDLDLHHFPENLN
jgi:sodium-dependent dicarboxylate transporter 2/3/5